MRYWQQNYAPGQSVEVRVQGQWRPGRVDDGWSPAPGFPVLVNLSDGPILVSEPENIRPA